MFNNLFGGMKMPMYWGKGREKGKRQPAGTKLIRAAREHKLGTRRGGIVSDSFRNMAIQRNLARRANK